MVRIRSDEKRRKVSGKHFALVAMGMASVTPLVGMVFPAGRHSAARQLFLPNHGPPLYANNSQTHHHPHHRAFGDYRISAGPPGVSNSTISKLKANNTSFLTSTRGVAANNKKRNRGDNHADDNDDSDDDGRPIFFLHVGLPKTGTTFLQCSICKDYYTKQNGNDTHGRHEQYFLQDNLVYIGTCPCEPPSNNFVLHNHDAIFDHNITWNEQHELGPMPFVSNKNNASTSTLNQTGMVPQLADSFRTRILQQVHAQPGRNALMIFEGCHKFDQAHVAALAAFLNPFFRVHIIVAYRRLFEWLPSKYNSVHKPIGYGPIVDDAWPGTTVEVMRYGRPINKTIPTTMPFALDDDRKNGNDTTSFGQLVRDIEKWQQHPAQIVRDNYARYFSHVEIIPLHDLLEPPREVNYNTSAVPPTAADDDAASSLLSINPYLHHLFCSVLWSAARHVCQAIRLGQIRGSESSTNPSVSLDYFRLAEAAHQQGWIPSHVPRSKVVRLVRDKMQADREAQRMHLQCLPNSTMSRILNLSLATEAKMFGSQQAEKWRQGHELAFEEYRSKNKYCWLDIDYFITKKRRRGRLRRFVLETRR